MLAPWRICQKSGRITSAAYWVCPSMSAQMHVSTGSVQSERTFPWNRVWQKDIDLAVREGDCVRKPVQRAMSCQCGRLKIRAHGLCATCYSLKRQDKAYFGGLRENVLERDSHRCRVCNASGREKRSIVVHHRVPGRSVLPMMLSLCPGCHSRVHRTKAVLSQMPPLLLQLWREQHPRGHEQTTLNFTAPSLHAVSAALF